MNTLSLIQEAIVGYVKALLEAKSAAEQAHDLGLHHVGWGYWANDKGEKVARTLNGQLIKLEAPQTGNVEAPAGEKEDVYWKELADKGANALDKLTIHALEHLGFEDATPALQSYLNMHIAYTILTGKVPEVASIDKILSPDEAENFVGYLDILANSKTSKLVTAVAIYFKQAIETYKEPQANPDDQTAQQQPEDDAWDTFALQFMDMANVGPDHALLKNSDFRQEFNAIAKMIQDDPDAALQMINAYKKSKWVYNALLATFPELKPESPVDKVANAILNAYTDKFGGVPTENMVKWSKDIIQSALNGEFSEAYESLEGIEGWLADSLKKAVDKIAGKSQDVAPQEPQPIEQPQKKKYKKKEVEYKPFDINKAAEILGIDPVGPLDDPKWATFEKEMQNAQKAETTAQLNYIGQKLKKAGIADWGSWKELLKYLKSTKKEIIQGAKEKGKIKNKQQAAEGTGVSTEVLGTTVDDLLEMLSQEVWKVSAKEALGPSYLGFTDLIATALTSAGDQPINLEDYLFDPVTGGDAIWDKDGNGNEFDAQWGMSHLEWAHLSQVLNALREKHPEFIKQHDTPTDVNSQFIPTGKNNPDLHDEYQAMEHEFAQFSPQVKNKSADAFQNSIAELGAPAYTIDDIWALQVQIALAKCLESNQLDPLKELVENNVIDQNEFNVLGNNILWGMSPHVDTSSDDDLSHSVPSTSDPEIASDNQTEHDFNSLASSFDNAFSVWQSDDKDGLQKALSPQDSPAELGASIAGVNDKSSESEIAAEESYNELSSKLSKSYDSIKDYLKGSFEAAHQGNFADAVELVYLANVTGDMTDADYKALKSALNSINQTHDNKMLYVDTVPKVNKDLNDWTEFTGNSEHYLDGYIEHMLADAYVGKPFWSLDDLDTIKIIISQGQYEFLFDKIINAAKYNETDVEPTNDEPLSSDEIQISDNPLTDWEPKSKEEIAGVNGAKTIMSSAWTNGDPNEALKWLTKKIKEKPQVNSLKWQVMALVKDYGLDPKTVPEFAVPEQFKNTFQAFKAKNANLNATDNPPTDAVYTGGSPDYFDAINLANTLLKNYDGNVVYSVMDLQHQIKMSHEYSDKPNLMLNTALKYLNHLKKNVETNNIKTPDMAPISAKDDYQVQTQDVAEIQQKSQEMEKEFEEKVQTQVVSALDKFVNEKPEFAGFIKDNWDTLLKGMNVAFQQPTYDGMRDKLKDLLKTIPGSTKEIYQQLRWSIKNEYASYVEDLNKLRDLIKIQKDAEKNIQKYGSLPKFDDGIPEPPSTDSVETRAQRVFRNWAKATGFGLGNISHHNSERAIVRDAVINALTEPDPASVTNHILPLFTTSLLDNQIFDLLKQVHQERKHPGALVQTTPPPTDSVAKSKVVKAPKKSKDVLGGQLTRYKVPAEKKDAVKQEILSSFDSLKYVAPGTAKWHVRQTLMTKHGLDYATADKLATWFAAKLKAGTTLSSTGGIDQITSQFSADEQLKKIPDTYDPHHVIKHELVAGEEVIMTPTLKWSAPSVNPSHHEMAKKGAEQEAWRKQNLSAQDLADFHEVSNWWQGSGQWGHTKEQRKKENEVYTKLIAGPPPMTTSAPSGIERGISMPFDHLKHFLEPMEIGKLIYLGPSGFSEIKSFARGRSGQGTSQYASVLVRVLPRKDGTLKAARLHHRGHGGVSFDDAENELVIGTEKNLRVMKVIKHVVTSGLGQAPTKLAYEIVLQQVEDGITEGIMLEDNSSHNNYGFVVDNWRGVSPESVKLFIKYFNSSITQGNSIEHEIKHQVREEIFKRLNEIHPPEQANHLGLTYVGWGKWANEEGKIVAKTVEGSLVKINPNVE